MLLENPFSLKNRRIKMNAKTRYLTTGMALLLMGLSLAAAVTLTAPQSARAAGTVRYAAPNGLTTGNCNGNWANACTLQRALAVAVSGDEIWVKEGVHYPGATRTAAFALKNGVAVYGGFAGTETQRSQRNWQTHRTILSGDIDKNDITDGGVVTTTANLKGSNAYHVISNTNVISTTVLDGFFITAGQANGSFPNGSGGGMSNRSNSSPTLTNLTFSGNTAEVGGGMINYESSPWLTNVTFSGNSASSHGGGMYNSSSNPTLTNVTFSSNSAPYGGGMYNDSSPTLNNVTLSDNSATNRGGGMYNFGSPTLNHVTFSDNSATDRGGGMYNFGSPTLTNVTFSGNTANNSGGGMYNYQGSPTLMNVTFSGNTANNNGGGMSNDNSNPTLTNVTFSGNSAYAGGGMSNSSSSNPTLTNVIMWGNTAINGQGIYNVSSNPTIDYSDIQNCKGLVWNPDCGTSGGHNMNADPRFEDADGADNIPGTADDALRLQLTSPAIDAGKNAAVPAGITTDRDGKPRFVNIPTVPDTGSGTPPIVDMGAYEASLNVFLPLVVRNR